MDIQRAAAISALKQHPAWAELTADINETIDKYASALARTMLATGKPPESDGMSFEYKRGYLAGLKAVTQKPEHATAAIRRDAAERKDNDVDGTDG